jgi:hypothetical protein
MLTGAIVGAIVGLLVVVFNFFIKEQRFNKVLRSIREPGMEYSALYHYASFKRYKNSFKFFDSFGVLYLMGNTVYYKTAEGNVPLAFNMAECKIQMEPEWRWLKWFSITTPAGEKYYFNSHKMGAFKNNSDETVTGYDAIKAKTTASS